MYVYNTSSKFGFWHCYKILVRCVAQNK